MRGGGYHYVEIMACPSGCLNGGGQLPPPPAVAPGTRLDPKNLPTSLGGLSAKELVDRLEELYHSGGGGAEAGGGGHGGSGGGGGGGGDSGGGDSEGRGTTGEVHHGQTSGGSGAIAPAQVPSALVVPRWGARYVCAYPPEPLINVAQFIRS